jgi:subtilisin family serine protease
MPRLRSALLCAACAGSLALALGGSGTRAATPPAASIDEAGWQGVLGVRAAVSTWQRHIVVLRAESLSSRVSAEGGQATESQMRSWTTAAVGAQEQFLRRISASGALVTPEHRYVRVLNAFSARLDPTSFALLERDREVVGVYPVRAAYPAVDDATLGLPTSVPTSFSGLEVPGLDGSGVIVALLDTGVDRSHPFLRDNVLPGIDVITPGSGGIAQPHPTIPGRPERHGTELAGIGPERGPGGFHGITRSVHPPDPGGRPDAEADTPCTHEPINCSPGSRLR